MRVLATLQAAGKVPPEIAVPLRIDAAEIQTVIQHLLASV